MNKLINKPMYVCTHVCSRLSHLWITATPRLQVVLHKATAMDAKAITSIELSASRAQCVTCVAWWLDTQVIWVCQNLWRPKKNNERSSCSLTKTNYWEDLRVWDVHQCADVLRVWPIFVILVPSAHQRKLTLEAASLGKPLIGMPRLKPDLSSSQPRLTWNLFSCGEL